MKRNIKSKDYFNEYELNKTKDLGSILALSVKEEYENYFLNHPKDYTAYPYYAVFLIKNKQLDEASKILDYAYNSAKKDTKFIRSTPKFNILEKKYILYKLKINFYQEKYSEVLKLYQKYYEKISDLIPDTIPMIVYCQKMCGLITEQRESGRSYLYRQIIKYNEEDFRIHIKKHLANDAINMEEPSNSIFVPDFPIDRVIKEIKKYIPSNKCTYPGGIENMYIFKYDECGRDNYHMTDYFKVYCFHNTKEFITITPSTIKEINFSYVDLNYLKKDTKTPVKRKSQIEKFYQKYKNIPK